MDIKMLFPVFISIFLAELGDKTQIATLLFAADKGLSKLGVFIASSTALVTASLLAVLLGSTIDRLLSQNIIKAVAGSVFIVMGIWILLSLKVSSPP